LPAAPTRRRSGPLPRFDSIAEHAQLRGLDALALARLEAELDQAIVRVAVLRGRVDDGDARLVLGAFREVGVLGALRGGIRDGVQREVEHGALAHLPSLDEGLARQVDQIAHGGGGVRRDLVGDHVRVAELGHAQGDDADQLTVAVRVHRDVLGHVGRPSLPLQALSP
jgi:hypothetical protein